MRALERWLLSLLENAASERTLHERQTRLDAREERINRTVEHAEVLLDRLRAEVHLREMADRG